MSAVSLQNTGLFTVYFGNHHRVIRVYLTCARVSQLKDDHKAEYVLMLCLKGADTCVDLGAHAHCRIVALTPSMQLGITESFCLKTPSRS